MADDEDDTTPADDDDVSEKHPLTQAKSPFSDDDDPEKEGDEWQPPVP